MPNTSLSDKYAIAAAIGLLLMVLFENAVLMLVVSLAGLIAGLWIARAGSVRRVVIVAMVAFAVAAAFAVIMLLR